MTDRSRRRLVVLWTGCSTRQALACVILRSYYFCPSSSIGAGPWRADVASRFGEADRMRRDRRERPRRGGREQDNRVAEEDGTMPGTRAVCQVGLCDLRRLTAWGRRAPDRASPRPEAGRWCRASGARSAPLLILTKGKFGNLPNPARTRGLVMRRSSGVAGEEA
jgi:hypothetical protein